MRTFIAIDVSDDIRESLAQVIAHLKNTGADVKWVAPENIHLTLKFLGDIDEKKSQQVEKALDGIAKVSRQFEINIKDLGAFPEIGFPRVVWAGLGRGASESRIVAAQVDAAMEGLGFERERRPFEPHLTLGRVRSPKNSDKLKDGVLTHSLKLKSCSCNAGSMILFQSRLTPKGSIYTKLHESKFPQQR